MISSAWVRVFGRYEKVYVLIVEKDWGKGELSSVPHFKGCKLLVRWPNSAHRYVWLAPWNIFLKIEHFYIKSGFLISL